MFVTVVICTLNRAKLLNDSLAQMLHLEIPSSLTWELLIVDNNSVDGTSDVIEDYCEKLPVRRVVERKQGLAHARNCGWREATGELLLWTDDDVLVDQRWLSAYAEAANRWPQAGFFGGPVYPLFEVEPPRWVTANVHLLAGMLAKLDYGPNEKSFGAGEAPFGASMAIRRHLFDKVSFNPKFGRRGKEPLGGEETAFFRAVYAMGERGVWVPGARVNHVIIRDRLTLPYVWTWHLARGKTHVRLNGLPCPRRLPRFPRRLYWFLRALGCFVQFVFLRVLGHQAWFLSFSQSATLFGMVRETLLRPQVGEVSA